MNYNTDINIIGSIPDYHLIYKSLPLLYAKDEMLEKILVADNEFNLRTEKSRKRFLSVLSSAFVTENESLNDFVGQLFAQQTIDEESKGIILFWLFSINNQLFLELNRDVFLKYLYQGRAELPVTDVIAYLKDVISRHSEMKGKWSELTIKTIASKYLTTLVKLNLLEGRQKKKFRFIRITDELIVCLIHMYTLLDQQGANFLEHEARAERVAAHKIQVQKQQEEFQLQLEELKRQYGDYSFDMVLGYFQENNMEKHILVFESSKILYIANEPMPFEKIIGFELKDNQTTVTKTTSPKYKTSTNTGSMLGRAVVGGILTGGVGAVVGAATAKKTTEVVEEGKTTTTVKHNYRITLTIDDIANPVRVIDCKYHQDKAEQIANVLNVILHRNQDNVLNG